MYPDNHAQERRQGDRRQSENRNHFLIDINTVFRLFGKRYFFIFYFGRHLNPRQQEQLVNQRRVANWVTLFIFFALFAGFVYGLVTLVSYRLGQSSPSGVSTEWQAPQKPHAG